MYSLAINSVNENMDFEFLIFKDLYFHQRINNIARLAQSVEHETLNLRVVGSSPTLGDISF